MSRRTISSTRRTGLRDSSTRSKKPQASRAPFRQTRRPYPLKRNKNRPRRSPPRSVIRSDPGPRIGLVFDRRVLRYRLRLIPPPEHRLDAQFIHGLNKAADIVTKDFTQGLVHHRSVGLAPHGVP